MSRTRPRAAFPTKFFKIFKHTRNFDFTKLGENQCVSLKASTNIKGFVHVRRQSENPSIKLNAQNVTRPSFAGVWKLWDAYTGTGFASGVISFTSGCFLLLVLKSFRNVVAPPLVTVSDFDNSYFFIKTRFRIKVCEKAHGVVGWRGFGRASHGAGSTANQPSGCDCRCLPDRLTKLG